VNAPDPTARYAYLHGFASGPLTQKGQALRRRLARRGMDLVLPDLNRPSFAELTVEGALAAVDELIAEGPAAASWRFIGSSFGGYVAALAAQRHPERIDRLLLLCPGFDLVDRWPELLGADRLAAWQRDGTFPIEDGAGVLTDVHWAFCESMMRHPDFPEIPCPTRIVHGRQDEVVPIETSRRYVARHPDVALIEVDDDHSLLASLDPIEEEAVAFLLEGRR